MSSPELESFKMNEEEIEDMYDPFRKKKKVSKNYNLYGVWADSSDEDDKKYKKNKLLKDYTKPVNFISGGVKVGDKVNKKDDEEGEDKISQDSDEEEEQPVPIRRRVKKAGIPVMKTKGCGDWEKHNKGIGSKLMRMMGHKEGTGLGKRSQGIVKPIEAFLRKGRGAIGLYGSESKQEESDLMPSKKKTHDSDAEEENEFKKKMQRWKKGEATTKTKFYTADELLNSKEVKSKLSEKPTKLNDPAQVKIIDMTGKEKRVLSGYHALSNKKVDEESVVVERFFDHPELVHNLEVLVNMAEEDIIQNTKRLNYEKDSLLNLQLELERLDDVCKQDEVTSKRLQSIISILDQVTDISGKVTSFSDVSLNKCFTLMERLKQDYQEEFHLHDLPSEMVQAIEPMVMRMYKGWKPLQNPDHGLEAMTRLKGAMTVSSTIFTMGHGEEMKAFDKLLWQAVVLCIRDSVRGWDVRQPNQMLVLIEKWVSLMHPSVVATLMDQFIFSKLQMEIGAWDPLTDPVPIHSWVQPWLFLMKKRITSLYPTIRLKLGNALSQWHPSDPSAKLILEPWVNVFETNQLDIFLVKFILPKLAFCLQQMEINPNNQNLESWNSVMEWADLMPQTAMASMVSDHFLPRWFHVLSSWASSSHANPKEITEWYFGWKERIPPRLCNDPIIKRGLREGMRLMTVNPSNPHPPAFRRNVSEFLETRGVEAGVEDQGLKFMSIKERLDYECRQRGIMFVPVSNKMHDGKQIYRVGSNTLVYFERRIIFYLDDGRWRPTSNIETLLNKLH